MGEDMHSLLDIRRVFKIYTQIVLSVASLNLDLRSGRKVS